MPWNLALIGHVTTSLGIVVSILLAFHLSRGDGSPEAALTLLCFLAAYLVAYINEWAAIVGNQRLVNVLFLPATLLTIGGWLALVWLIFRRV